MTIGALVQVAGPAIGQDPVHWFLGLLAGAVGVLFWQLQKAKDEMNNTCQADKKICTDALSAAVVANTVLTTEIRTNHGDVKAGIKEILDHVRNGRKA